MREVTLKPVMRYSTPKRTPVNVGEINFHDSHTGEPWKKIKPIRKVVWAPALKRAGLKHQPPIKPGTPSSPRSFQEAKTSSGLPIRWNTKIGGKSEKFTDAVFRKRKSNV
jgi:hypothetical protein